MPKYFEFKLSLQGVKTPPWRRFLLKDSATFADLHRAIQDAAGYWDYHLYEFIGLENKPLAGSPHDEDGRAPSAARVDLKSYFPIKNICGYIYDFGDEWVHAAATVYGRAHPPAEHRFVFNENERAESFYARLS